MLDTWSIWVSASVGLYMSGDHTTGVATTIGVTSSSKALILSCSPTPGKNGNILGVQKPKMSKACH